jgi:hypothetical protein
MQIVASTVILSAYANCGIYCYLHSFIFLHSYCIHLCAAARCGGDMRKPRDIGCLLNLILLIWFAPLVYTSGWILRKWALLLKRSVPPMYLFFRFSWFEWKWPQCTEHPISFLLNQNSCSIFSGTVSQVLQTGDEFQWWGSPSSDGWLRISLLAATIPFHDR